MTNENERSMLILLQARGHSAERSSAFRSAWCLPGALDHEDVSVQVLDDAIGALHLIGRGNME
jgi:hypothetical protein